MAFGTHSSIMRKNSALHFSQLRSMSFGSRMELISRNSMSLFAFSKLACVYLHTVLRDNPLALTGLVLTMCTELMHHWGPGNEGYSPHQSRDYYKCKTCSLELQVLTGIKRKASFVLCTREEMMPLQCKAWGCYESSCWWWAKKFSTASVLINQHSPPPPHPCMYKSGYLPHPPSNCLSIVLTLKPPMSRPGISPHEI